MCNKHTVHIWYKIFCGMSRRGIEMVYSYSIVRAAARCFRGGSLRRRTGSDSLRSVVIRIVDYKKYFYLFIVNFVINYVVFDHNWF